MINHYTYTHNPPCEVWQYALVPSKPNEKKFIKNHAKLYIVQYHAKKTQKHNSPQVLCLEHKNHAIATTATRLLQTVVSVLAHMYCSHHYFVALSLLSHDLLLHSYAKKHIIEPFIRNVQCVKKSVCLHVKSWCCC